jgi:hypothetical protein
MEPRKRDLLVTSMGALVLGSPLAAVAQAPASRPAGVSLTVVVPARPPSLDAFATPTELTVVRRSPTVAELTPLVGLGARVASRVEVRLGSGATGDSLRVWVRTTSGVLERLTDLTSVVAVDVPAARAAARHAVTFVIESDRQIATEALALPLLYRLRTGSGEATTTWSYAAYLRGADAP